MLWEVSVVLKKEVCMWHPSQPSSRVTHAPPNDCSAKAPARGQKGKEGP